MIQKEAFEKSFKDDVKRKLEGTKTPNGTIIKDGKIIYSCGLGLRDVNKNLDITRTTVVDQFY